LAKDRPYRPRKASLPEMEALLARRLFSKPIYAKEERDGPPSANNSLSTAKPRSSMLSQPKEVTSQVESCIMYLKMCV